MSDSPAQHAMILSGFGANAAYEVGVMKVLLRERWGKDGNPPFEPYCYSATSVGALNAAVIAAQADRSLTDALDYLERLWTERIAGDSDSTVNGIFRVRTDLTQYWGLSHWFRNPLRPVREILGDLLHIGDRAAKRLGLGVATEGPLLDRALVVADFSEFVDLSPGEQLLEEVIGNGMLALSPRKVFVTAVNWESGLPRTFSNKDLGGPEGRSAILGAFSPIGVAPSQSVEGYPYVDASVLMDSPLKPAIDAHDASSKGPLVLHLVYLDANMTEIPVPKLPNTFASLYRVFGLALTRSVLADLRRAAAINDRIRTRELLNLAAAGGENLEEAIRAKLGASAVPFWQELQKDTQDKLPLTVHRHCPRKHIHGFQFVQFGREKIGRLIEAGCQDALKHDCEEAQCLLPK